MKKTELTAIGVATSNKAIRVAMPSNSVNVLFTNINKVLACIIHEAKNKKLKSRNLAPDLSEN